MKKKKIAIIIAIIILIGVITGIILKLNKKSKEYEILKITKYDYFVVRENNKYGVTNKQGDIIINTQYDNLKIPNPTKAVFICYEGEKTKILNENQEEIFTEYENITPLRLKNISSDLMYEKTVLSYKKNDKYGIIDLEGKKLTNAIYEEIDTLKLKEGELIVKKDGKYGVININGATLVEPKYDNIEVDGYYTSENSYKNAGYIVSNTTDDGYRYGYVNLEGKLIVDTIYNDLKRINEIKDENVYLICAQNGKYGVIKNGNKIVQNNYQSITYSNNLLIVQSGKKYGVMSIEGRDIIGAEYNQIDTTGDYLYAINSEGHTQVFDKQGKKQEFDSNTEFLNVDNTNYKIIIKSENNKTIYGIYENGEITTTQEYNYIEYLFDNYFIACNTSGKLGIIDNIGTEVVKFDYTAIQKIGDTQLIQTANSNTNITDIYSNKMQNICTMLNATIKNKEDYIKIYSDNDIVYLSKEGQKLTSADALKDNKIFAKKKGTLWGFVDASGNTIVDFKYDKVTELNEYGFAGIEKDEKWGIIDNLGNIIVEPTYLINSSNEPSFIGEYYQVQYGYGEIYYTK